MLIGNASPINSINGVHGSQPVPRKSGSGFPGILAGNAFQC